jgi:hypothetical protein
VTKTSPQQARPLLPEVFLEADRFVEQDQFAGCASHVIEGVEAALLGEEDAGLVGIPSVWSLSAARTLPPTRRATRSRRDVYGVREALYLRE